MPRLIPYAQLRPTPWKNGGGITRQIAIWPPEASLEDFQWRISTAEVRSEGPFSSYPCVDRILIVATPGRQTVLSSPDWAAPRPLHYGIPLYFHGETPITATLPDGPLRDFNVMCRRGQACTSLQVHSGPATLQSGGECRLLHSLGGTAILHVPTGEELRLAPGDSLLWPSADPAHFLELTALAVGGQLIDVQLRPR